MPRDQDGFDAAASPAAHGLAAGEGALEVLEYIQELELSPTRWDRLAALVEIAIEAYAAGDAAGLRQATAELAKIGPVRIKRIGEAPAVPPPQPVRERMNYLVHELRAAGTTKADAANDNAGQGRGSR